MISEDDLTKEDIKLKKSAFLNKCYLIVMINSFIIMGISLVIILGWRFNIPIITNISAFWMSSKVNSAFSFMLSGAALSLLGKKTIRAYSLPAVVLSSIFIILVSGLTQYEYIFDVNLGIDQLLIKDNLLILKPAALNRMTFTVACAFQLAAISFLLLLNRKYTSLVTQILSGSIFLVASLSLFNFIYNINLFSDISTYTSMSLLSAVLFILISVSIFMLNPEVGVVKLLMENTSRGYFLRRIIPSVFLVPVMLSVLENFMKMDDVLDQDISRSLIAVVTFCILSVIAISVSRMIDTVEKKLIHINKEVAKNELAFREFAENVDFVFYKASPDLKELLYINKAYEKVWGKKIESLYKNPFDWFESIVPEDQQKMRDTFLKDLLSEKREVSAEYRIMRPDGLIRNIFSKSIKVKDENDKIFCVIGLAIDMTDINQEKRYLLGQKEILEILHENKSIYQTFPKILKSICKVFDWGFGEIWLIDESTKSLRCVSIWHKELNEMLEYGEKSRTHTFKLGEGLPGRIWKELKPVWIPDYSSRRNYSRSSDAAIAGLNCAFGVPIIFQDKVFGIMEFFGHHIPNPDTDLLMQLNSIGNSLAEFIYHAYTREQIQALSRQDILTGLMNRSTLEENLNNLIKEDSSNNIAIFILDIDRFKIINEALGHHIGDLVLKEIALRLSGLVEPEINDTARLEADKFIVYYHHLKDFERIIHYEKQIKKLFIDPIHINHQTFHLTLSLGIALYPQDGNESKTLIENADLAMAHAKIQGGDKSVFFTEDLLVNASKKLMMYSDLGIAMSENQFYLNFQPQIDAVTGTISGAEALVRWQHPTLGLINPANFIPYAENTGLIVALNEHILRLVFQLIPTNWGGPIISVNISAQQFQDKSRLLNFLKSLIKEFSVNPKMVELEITEGIIMEDIQKNVSTLAELHEMGFEFSIDDFGTGFSSFSYLYKIPAYKIKIDKSFINDLPESHANSEIVKSMIVMLHALNKKVVAEGVETAAQMEFLKKEKCDIIQGFYYFKPMPFDDFLALIKNSKETV